MNITRAIHKEACVQIKDLITKMFQFLKIKIFMAN